MGGEGGVCKREAKEAKLDMMYGKRGLAAKKL